MENIIIKAKTMAIIPYLFYIEVMKIKAVIFDMDGTLLDSEPLWLRADLAMVASYGGFMSEEEHDNCIGMGSVNFVNFIKEKYGITAPAEELLEFQKRTYLEIAREEIKAFPEMTAFARWAKEKGLKTAIASGSSPQIIEETTEQAGIRELFFPRLSAQDAGRGKPAPDVFLLAAKQLGVPPKNCLVMEDSPLGVEAARRAGMIAAAIPLPTAPDTQNYLAHAEYLFKEGMREFTSEKMIQLLKEKGRI